MMNKQKINGGLKYKKKKRFQIDPFSVPADEGDAFTKTKPDIIEEEEEDRSVENASDIEETNTHLELDKENTNQEMAIDNIDLEYVSILKMSFFCFIYC